MEKYKKYIQIGLAVVIVLLVYFVYDSIRRPIRFLNEKEMREAVVIDRLKDIRSAQVAYRSVYSEYTGDFDTLVDFIRYGKLPIIRKIGDAEDTLAVLIRDTTYVSVFDSLFRKRTSGYVDSLPFIPFSGGEKFHLQAGKIERSRVMLPVFEAFAANRFFLKGLNPDYFDPEEGLSVGNMDAPTIDGNWE